MAASQTAYFFSELFHCVNKKERLQNAFKALYRDRDSERPQFASEEGALFQL